MSEQRSRVIKYEDLRRKIENLSYFSLNDQLDNSSTSSYDLNASKNSVKSSSTVRHNTLTVPLDNLLNEVKKKDDYAINSTQELKLTDENNPSKGKKSSFSKFMHESIHSSKPLYKNWIFWTIIILTIAIIICLILCFTLIN